ncbi:MAG: hypothetical protein M1818_000410 [Claussenomyces sp. TS43310]|nr:MAG: hypothetical protein M1818_000410 [Claussenomyces sp. TS43310]
MVPPPLIDDSDDGEYASSEDSDFAPDHAAIDVASDSEGTEDEVVPTAVAKPNNSAKRKRRDDGDAEDLGFENSGDEAIIAKAKRRKGGRTDENDAGGEGGFVRTRAMKAAAPEERKVLVDAASATVDVDALWANMISGPPKRPAIIDVTDGSAGVDHKDNFNGVNQTTATQLQGETEASEMITIERTYTFAGKKHSEMRVVPRNSAEAKLYLASQSSMKADAHAAEPSGPRLRKAPKARRSIFEPISEPLPQRTDLRFKVSTYVPITGKLGKEGAAKKLNTVEKSALDWAGFVDKEGIKDELETAGKAKGTYLSNQDFLARAEDRREEEARRARLKEKGL